MVKRTFFLMAVILIMIFVIAEIKADDSSKQVKNKEEQIKDAIKASDVQINFYGRVIDQNGNPVEDANVRVHVRHFDPSVKFWSMSSKQIILKTKNKGRFELINEEGSLFFIDNIEKKGFEFIDYPNMKRGFEYAAPLEKDRFKPDKNNPVVFHMRKKEPPTLVIPGEFKKGLGAEGIEYEVDLVRDRSLHKRGYLGKYDKNEHADLLIRAIASKNLSDYTVTFTTPDKDSGIIISDELLYITPESGYKSNQVIKVNADERIKKYLYLRGRSGGIYSRLDTEISAGEKGVHIEIKSWTNPNGLRNVDYDPDMYIENVRRENEEQKRRNIEREEGKLKVKNK